MVEPSGLFCSLAGSQIKTCQSWPVIYAALPSNCSFNRRLWNPVMCKHILETGTQGICSLVRERDLQTGGWNASGYLHDGRKLRHLREGHLL